MAEAFSNSVTRAIGIVTSYSGSTIGAAATSITVTANTGIGVSDLVVNTNFIAGTKVKQIVGTTIYTDRASTNAASASSQIVKFLGVTTAYSSPSGTKSILIGGTFANNTDTQVNLTVEVLDQSIGVSTGVGDTTVGTVSLASKIPVPTGSSFVISDAGKTILESLDEVRVYVDSSNAIDANLSILTGVN